jgi:murein DD-endopeptidase MepM/ murein hydrolase activator NlpD
MNKAAYAQDEEESTYEELLSQAQKRKKDAEAAKEKTQEKINEINNKKDNLLAYIQSLDQQVSDMQVQIQELESEIIQLNVELVQTKKDLVKAKKDEAEQYTAMKRRIKYMYENGDTDIFDIFLNSDSLSDILNQMEYARKISEYDDRLLDSYVAAKKKVEDEEAYEEAQIEEQTAVKAQLEYDEEQTEKLLDDKNSQLEKYMAALDVNEDMLEEYGEDALAADADIGKIKKDEADRIAKEEAAAAAAAAAKAAEKSSSGSSDDGTVGSDSGNLHAAEGLTQTDNTDPSTMIWPLPGDSEICTHFGYRIAPIAGASTYHQGIDIGAAAGEQIVAVLAGTVTASEYSVSRGNYVEIDHQNGYVTRYMHCSKLLVSAGEYVKQGEIIGLVGSTGISTAPHLHFSIVINGVNVDPEQYVSYN